MRALVTLMFLIVLPMSSQAYYNCTSKVLTSPPNRKGGTVTKVYSMNLLSYRLKGKVVTEGHLVTRVITNSFLTDRGVADCDEAVTKKKVWDGSCYPQYQNLKFEREEVEVNGEPMTRYSSGRVYFYAPIQTGEGFEAEFHFDEYAKPFAFFCSHGDIG